MLKNIQGMKVSWMGFGWDKFPGKVRAGPGALPVCSIACLTQGMSVW
jgi:hypothetical protein